MIDGTEDLAEFGGFFADAGETGLGLRVFGIEEAKRRDALVGELAGGECAERGGLGSAFGFRVHGLSLLEDAVDGATGELELLRGRGDGVGGGIGLADGGVEFHGPV